MRSGLTRNLGSTPVYFARLIRRTLADNSRRFICCALLATVVVGSIGFPVLPGSTGERFPCEGHACGCRDAQSCWRNCCCKTNLEKLAWAFENRVTPPEYVVAAAKVELVRTGGSACCGGGQCCKDGSQPKSSRLAQLKHRLSPTANLPQQENPPESELSAPSFGLKLVPLAIQQRCRGLTAVWWMLGHVVVDFPAPPQMSAPLPGERIAICSEFALSRGDAPETPPPNFGPSI